MKRRMRGGSQSMVFLKEKFEELTGREFRRENLLDILQGLNAAKYAKAQKIIFLMYGQDRKMLPDWVKKALNAEDARRSMDSRREEQAARKAAEEEKARAAAAAAEAEKARVAAEANETRARRAAEYPSPQQQKAMNNKRADELKKAAKVLQAPKAELLEEIMQAKNLAIRLLQEKEIYTKPELLEVLSREGFSREGINTSIEDLEKAGFIKDKTFAQNWIRRREKSNPRGKEVLKLELAGKGVALSTIDQVLSSIDPNRELDTALRLAEKQVKRYKSLEPHVAKRRLHGFLARRGFSYNTVGQVMHKILSKLI